MGSCRRYCAGAGLAGTCVIWGVWLDGSLLGTDREVINAGFFGCCWIGFGRDGGGNRGAGRETAFG
jgi:hypothetical protein